MTLGVFMTPMARMKRCTMRMACALLVSSGWLLSSGCDSSLNLDVYRGGVDAAMDADGWTFDGADGFGRADAASADARGDTQSVAAPDATTPDDPDASTPDDPDASTPDDASTDAQTGVGADASGPGDVGVPDTGAQDGGATEPESDPRFEVEMTFTTANIGRNYNSASDVQAVFNEIGDVIGAKSGPKFIGWQEIGGADPCGADCEIDALRNRFKSQWGWTTHRPRGTRPNGNRVRVAVPVTSKGANGSARAVFASPSWARVSATRFVTVAYYADRNLSVLNTHFIAGAWSCKPNLAQRRDYWRRAWRVLKAEVAREHQRGRNVIVTGDLNRPRGANSCNPAWSPTSLHSRAQIIGGAGIDYIFAVPGAGQEFVVSRRPNGTRKRGNIFLGIDSHKAYWVQGRFRQR